MLAMTTELSKPAPMTWPEFAHEFTDDGGYAIDREWADAQRWAELMWEVEADPDAAGTLLRLKLNELNEHRRKAVEARGYDFKPGR